MASKEAQIKALKEKKAVLEGAARILKELDAGTNLAAGLEVVDSRLRLVKGA